jgi:hypothetical protein
MLYFIKNDSKLTEDWAMQQRLFQPGYQDSILKSIKTLPAYQSSLNSDKIHQMLNEDSGAIIVPRNVDPKDKSTCEFSIYFVLPKQSADERNHMLRLDFEITPEGSFIFRENVPNQFAFLWELHPELANGLIGIGVTIAKGATSSPLTSPKSAASYSDDLSVDEAFSPKSPSLASTTSLGSPVASETKQASPASSLHGSEIDFSELKKGARRKPVMFEIETLIAREGRPNKKSTFQFQVDSDSTVTFPERDGAPAFTDWNQQEPLIEQFMDKFAHRFLSQKHGKAHLVFDLSLDGKDQQFDIYVDENGVDASQLEAQIKQLQENHPDFKDALQNILSTIAVEEQKKPESKSL